MYIYAICILCNPNQKFWVIYQGYRVIFEQCEGDDPLYMGFLRRQSITSIMIKAMNNFPTVTVTLNVQEILYLCQKKIV